MADALIEGHPPTPEQRANSEQRVVRAGQELAAGTSTRIPMSPEWDNLVLDTFEKGDLVQVDGWTAECPALLRTFPTLRLAVPFEVTDFRHECPPTACTSSRSPGDRGRPGQGPSSWHPSLQRHVPCDEAPDATVETRVDGM